MATHSIEKRTDRIMMKVAPSLKEKAQERAEEEGRTLRLNYGQKMPYSITMLIRNELTLNGMRLAYCVGEDIPTDLKCRKIRIGGKLYDVIKANSSVAFCGKMNAILQLSLNNDEKMPMGEFEIVE